MDDKIIYAVRITPTQRDALQHFLTWHPEWDVEEVDINQHLERGNAENAVNGDGARQAEEEDNVPPVQDNGPSIGPVDGAEECEHCLLSAMCDNSQTIFVGTGKATQTWQ